MADTKVSALTAATTLNLSDYFLLVQGGSSLKVSAETIALKMPSRIIVNESAETITTGAIATNKLTTKIAIADPAAAYTLAAGTHGMEKVIVCNATSGAAPSATVTVTSGSGFSTITFDSIGDIAYLKNIDGLWYKTAENNGSGTFTSISASGQITSTVTTGTSPLVIASTTPVANLSIGGNAATATTSTNATNTGITDDVATATTVYPTWVTAATGNLPQKVSSTKISFVPSTGVLTATGFSGPLTGNVTGNVTGSSGSCTGNSSTATTATNLSGGTVSGTTITASTSIGYVTGAGGAITQITSRVTGVTLNKVCGSITTDTTSLAAETAAVFTVTNSTIEINDVVVISQRSGSNGGNTSIEVVAVAAGSFDIKVANNNAAAGTAETGAIIINFAIIKAVTA